MSQDQNLFIVSQAGHVGQLWFAQRHKFIHSLTHSQIFWGACHMQGTIYCTFKDTIVNEPMQWLNSRSLLSNEENRQTASVDPLGKPGVTYLYLWQREALNMPKKEYPPNCKQWRITTRSHKRRAVGKGTKKQVSIRTWRWLDVLIKEKAACLLTGGCVSE